MDETEFEMTEPQFLPDSDDCPHGHGSIPADCATDGCICQCFDCRNRRGEVGP